MKKIKKDIIYALSAVFFWSTVATAFKLALKGLTPEQLLFWASFSSAVTLFFFAYKEDKNELKEQFTKKYFFKNVLFGALNPFVYYLVLFKAYDLLPAQEAQPLNYTWPIVVSVFSIFFLKQKFSAKIFVGLFSAFFGIVIIATRGNLGELKFENPWGTFLALFSALVWATFWTLKLKDKRKDSIKLFASFFYGSVLALLYLLLKKEFVFPQPQFLFAAVYVGLFEMGITFMLWLKGMNVSENKAKTSTLAYLSPFLSLIFIALVLGETIRVSSIVGLVFIIGGILFQNLSFKKKKSSPA